MILIEFLLAPTVPSPPRPQNLHSMVLGAAVLGQSWVLGKREVRHVVDDANGKLARGLVFGELGVHREDRAGRRVLGPQTVATAGSR